MVNYTREDLLDHHAVGAVIRNSDGHVLMQNHVKFGFWTIPIGKAKPDQTPLEAVKEEILEECNLIIEELTKISSERKDYQRNDRLVNVMTHLYDVLGYSGEMKNNEPHKHTEQKFLPIEEIKLLPYISDATVAFLKSIGFERESKIEAENLDECESSG